MNLDTVEGIHTELKRLRRSTNAPLHTQATLFEILNTHRESVRWYAPRVKNNPILRNIVHHIDLSPQ